MKLSPIPTGLLLLSSLAAPGASQVPGQVVAEARLAEGSLGFAGPLDAGDEFGRAVCALGDVDGDGTPTER